ncbi:hypothetical protein [Litoreibacter arenae]|uniref:Uncharacterized protein n=1 Tax=Litoreibacter arenae DSM 19593 TaxID=1123360 RepID=S9QPQ3_9RHOB|nr:hypothetical protein [Litoreibacter arenae]EPX81573.1 hypothetical protein thalar_00128 [Litoreibacter arenae DSM 19593]
MRRSLISLYVLLTTRLPIPKGLLARAIAVIFTYTAALAIVPQLALNIAVAMGLAATLWVRLPQAWFEGENRDASTGATILAVSLSLIAICLFLPANMVQISISLGFFVMAALYGLIWAVDPDMLDKMGWDVNSWGVEGRANAVRWQVVRSAALGVANAYTASNLIPHEWIVAHAILPLAAYYLYHWTVLSTHPHDDP